jgi:hypothetical protein
LLFIFLQKTKTEKMLIISSFFGKKQKVLLTHLIIHFEEVQDVIDGDMLWPHSFGYFGAARFRYSDASLVVDPQTSANGA